MASCPHCQTPLADPYATQCPVCGGVVSPAAAMPAGPPPLPEGTGQEETGQRTGHEAGQETGQGTGQGGAGGRAGGGGFVHPPPPPNAYPPDPPKASPNAWENRNRIGFAAAFVETTREVLLRPQAFFRTMPTSGGLGSPLLYAVVAGWIGLAAAAFYQAIWVSILGPSTLPFGLDRRELAYLFDWLESWTGLLTQAVFGGLSVAISVFVAAAILHVVLLVLGGARRGFEATFRVVCFSQATTLLLLIPLFLIPFCGLLVFVWCLALYVIGLAEAHQAGYGQAIAAVLLPLVAVCCCCAGSIALFAGAIASVAGQLQ